MPLEGMSSDSPVYGRNVAIHCRTNLSFLFSERLSNVDHHVNDVTCRKA
jgi:hypothetical protein